MQQWLNLEYFQGMCLQYSVYPTLTQLLLVLTPAPSPTSPHIPEKN